MNFKEKRYTVWTDETAWRKTAVESGLRYGIYDNQIDNCLSTLHTKEEFGIITSLQRAREVATILNEREELNHERTIL